MSAVPKYPFKQGYAGLRMTAEQFLSLGESTERLELVGGVVTLSPTPSFRHQKVSSLIQAQIVTWAAQNAGAEFAHDIDVRLSASVVYRPDVVVFAPGRLNAEPLKVDTPPDLIIELLSPGTENYDLVTKRADYEAFGVKEYVVINPDDGTARVFRREGPKFTDVAVQGFLVASAALPGFVLDLRPLRPRH